MAEILGASEEGKRDENLNFFARQCKGISNYKVLQRLLLSSLLVRCKECRQEPLEMLVLFTPLKTVLSPFSEGRSLVLDVPFLMF